MSTIIGLQELKKDLENKEIDSKSPATRELVAMLVDWVLVLAEKVDELEDK